MNICIFIILYDLCLLPAQLHYDIINMWYLESHENHVQLMDECALWKFTNGEDNLVFQVLKFEKVGTCSKFPGRARISHLIIVLYGGSI
jgi:hypothetical protein